MELVKKISEEGIDFCVINLKAGDNFHNVTGVENGILHIAGQITINCNGDKYTKERVNPFDQRGTFIHLNKFDNCAITTANEAQIVVIDIANNKLFNTKIYHEKDITEIILDTPKLEGKDKRKIRNIVDMGTEPDANIIIGEVISDAGCWSSYPPHFHEQPELYFYKFNHQKGFGISVVGDNAKVVTNDDITIIPGNLPHPQSSAPGYKMYYVWVIRNLEGNPWNERNYVKCHQHLLEDK